MSSSWLDRLPQTDPSMSKRAFITNITPLPPNISRDTAIGLLHHHSLMIELNPLVIRHRVTEPPPNATEEEKDKCTWYEITDEINYLPGGAAKGELTYKGGFYNLPFGLQTHVFAPGGVDMKAIWKVSGSAAGEPPEEPELGVNVPTTGLYLREDVEVRCNVFLMSFVKRNMKKSHHVLVERLLKKAHEVEDKRQQLPQQQQKMTGYSTPSSLASSSRLQNFGPGREMHAVPPQTSRQSTPQEQTGSGQQYAASRPLLRNGGMQRETYPEEHDSSRQQYLLKPTDGVRSESFGFGKPLPPEPPGTNGNGPHYQSPQLFGEQAELATSTQSIEREDIWPDAPPNLGPSAPRDVTGGEVVELDSAEVGYWRQR